MSPTSREIAALVRRHLIGADGCEDVDAVDIFLAEDVMYHNLVFGGEDGQGVVSAQGWRVIRTADIRLTIEEVVATTVRPFEITYPRLSCFQDGWIAEIHSLGYDLEFMRQLNRLPEFPQTGLPSNRPTTHD